LITPLKSFILIASNKAEKVDWMITITETTKEWKAKKYRLTGRKDTTGMPKEEAPVWTPDFQVTSCQECGDSFSLTKRKHHCRSCGSVFCNNCSKEKINLPNLGTDRFRVCKTCFADYISKSSWDKDLSLVRKQLTVEEKKEYKEKMIEKYLKEQEMSKEFLKNENPIMNIIPRLEVTEKVEKKKTTPMKEEKKQIKNRELLLYKIEPIGMKAIWTFQGEATDELSFKENAIVKILGKYSDYWWYGELDGKRGLVPGLYFER